MPLPPKKKRLSAPVKAHPNPQGSQKYFDFAAPLRILKASQAEEKARGAKAVAPKPRNVALQSRMSKKRTTNIEQGSRTGSGGRGPGSPYRSASDELKARNKAKKKRKK